MSSCRSVSPSVSSTGDTESLHATSSAVSEDSGEFRLSVERPLRPPPSLGHVGPLAQTSHDVHGIGAHQVHWYIDARKLESRDRQVVSPRLCFHFDALECDATFRLTILAQDGHRGFKSACGFGCILLKCETVTNRLNVGYRLSLGNDESSWGPATHDFAQNIICGLPTGQDVWNFKAGVDSNIAMLVVCLEMWPVFEQVPDAEMGGATTSIGAMPSNSQTQPCRYYNAKNGCANGLEMCPVFEQVPDEEMCGVTTSIIARPSNSIKTQPCRFYRAKNGCRKGFACAYAHGEADLRDGVAHSLCRKTKLCTVYSRAGTCPLEGSCTFAHGNEELRASSRCRVKNPSRSNS